MTWNQFVAEIDRVFDNPSRLDSFRPLQSDPYATTVDRSEFSATWKPGDSGHTITVDLRHDRLWTVTMCVPEGVEVVWVADSPLDHCAFCAANKAQKIAAQMGESAAVMLKILNLGEEDPA